VRFPVLAITEFDNFWLNDQLKEHCKHIGAEVAPEGSHDPEELRQLQE
jgi:hypothetical protein